MTNWCAAFVLITAVTGCAGSALNGEEGAACVRLAQCASGLACVNGMCSSDLTALAEAGMVPVLDSGVVPDVVVNDEDAGN